MRNFEGDDDDDDRLIGEWRKGRFYVRVGGEELRGREEINGAENSVKLIVNFRVLLLPKLFFFFYLYIFFFYSLYFLMLRTLYTYVSI